MQQNSETFHIGPWRIEQGSKVEYTTSTYNIEETVAPERWKDLEDTLFDVFHQALIESVHPKSTWGFKANGKSGMVSGRDVIKVSWPHKEGVRSKIYFSIKNVRSAPSMPSYNDLQKVSRAPYDQLDYPEMMLVAGIYMYQQYGSLITRATKQVLIPDEKNQRLSVILEMENASAVHIVIDFFDMSKGFIESALHLRGDAMESIYALGETT